MKDWLWKRILKKSDIDLSYTNNKEKYLDNYILNAIVNHSRYHYRKNKKLVIDSNDIIQEIILKHYLDNKKQTRKDILKTYFTNTNSKQKFKNKQEIENAIRNINDEMEKASEEFSKLFDYGKERSDSLWQTFYFFY